MTINVSFEQIKKVAAVLLLAGNLFAIGAAVDYTLWRRHSEKAFELIDFDINDRLPQIQEHWLAKQAEASRQIQAAAEKAVPTTSTTLPKKK